MTYRMVDLIQKKRDGLELDKEEIYWIVNGYAAGTVPDYQMSAFAMALYFQGMTTDETTNLTMAMVGTGKQVDLSSIKGIKVDKHSTGGVGDKVSIILAPLVASFDVPVAKMSGRGLGHTGGTIDKLESVTNFNTELTEEKFIQQVQDLDLAIISQTDDLVKADKLLYALRDVTATVDIIPLIASSIMSKKIAAGADAILLDVTVGEGAFMKTIEDARVLASTMVELGKAVGRDTIAVLTDMQQPLGMTIGNKLEIIESIQVMQGKGSEELTEFICHLAKIMLSLAGLEKTEAEIRENLVSGAALKKFEELVAAQGGVVENIYEINPTKHSYEFKADLSGYIETLPADKLGILAMKAGAGRATKSDKIDFDAGIVLNKKIGDQVEEGETIFTIYYNNDLAASEIEELKNHINIGNQKKEIKEILEIIK
ncbi:pyrimidine-nucleoside phosphorylase [Floricoccus penangensis]|uniref:Pyrimidine-nucleoside phosphorylase n=1 Tax=Floricoccus penangensis TaxID=1859475 RepID=A0A9Q5P090_9LACT|nr:pyrimidine-nucleoside phosphorylase [Floricoccus penangensis]OFI46031.1 pyrimidine-nucleoside phosphorylase [Floricoccus penangensis]